MGLSFYIEVKKNLRNNSQNRWSKNPLCDTASFILMTLLEIFMQASLHNVN